MKVKGEKHKRKRKRSSDNSVEIKVIKSSPNGGVKKSKRVKTDKDFVKIKTGIKVEIKKEEPIKNEKKELKINSPGDYKTVKVEPLKESKRKTNWWDLKKGEQTVKWTSLRHNGMVFPPDYKPHGVKITYGGEEIEMNAEQEEVATWFAAIIETDHFKNAIFRRNFFSCWKKLFGKKSKKFKKLEKFDFRPIFDHLQREKERKALMRKDPEYKKKTKEEKERMQETYGYALVDGVKQRVANYSVEIPGLFRGRGKHPKAGMIKKRIMPEDIILNIGENDPVPKCPLEGHNWGGVIHNHNATYIAYWKDPIMNRPKQVILHASSSFRGQSDLKKFEIARELKKDIDKVREAYTMAMKSKSLLEMQKGTVAWIIDHLAIRIGNKKNTSKEADTVGVCSLRLEHIEFLPENKIKLDFLGKDSVRYLNTVKIDALAYKNLKRFTGGKSKSDLLFDLLNTRNINSYLKQLKKGVSAKVFRTFNASFTLQKVLMEKTVKNESIAKKKFIYDQANREVAILCNHQKAPAKSFDNSLSKLEEKLKERKKKQKELRKELKNSKKETANDKKKKRSPKIIKKALKTMKINIEKLEMNLELKKSTKEIALNTSKLNYCDPRITVAWCKRNEMPVEKIFPKTMLEKFPWAVEVSSDFVF